MAPKRKQTVKKATPKVTRAPPAKMKVSAKKIAKAIKKTPAKRAPAAAPDLTVSCHPRTLPLSNTAPNIDLPPPLVSTLAKSFFFGHVDDHALSIFHRRL
jgi:hypothetical protein